MAIIGSVGTIYLGCIWVLAGTGKLIDVQPANTSPARARLLWGLATVELGIGIFLIGGWGFPFVPVLSGAILSVFWCWRIIRPVGSDGRCFGRLQRAHALPHQHLALWLCISGVIILPGVETRLRLPFAVLIALWLLSAGVLASSGRWRPQPQRPGVTGDGSKQSHPFTSIADTTGHAEA